MRRLAAEVLDHGTVELIEFWGADEAIIESARMSTNKGFKGWGTPEDPGDERLLKYLYTHKHMTPFEMAGAIFEIKAPIFVFREHHRHRTQSFSEMSARYIPLPDENYVPDFENVLQRANAKTSNKQAAGSEGAVSSVAVKEWMSRLNLAYEVCQSVYDEGLELGIPKELARLAGGPVFGDEGTAGRAIVDLLASAED